MEDVQEDQKLVPAYSMDEHLSEFLLESAFYSLNSILSLPSFSDEACEQTVSFLSEILELPLPRPLQNFYMKYGDTVLGELLCRLLSIYDRSTNIIKGGKESVSFFADAAVATQACYGNEFVFLLHLQNCLQSGSTIEIDEVRTCCLVSQKLKNRTHGLCSGHIIRRSYMESVFPFITSKESHEGTEAFLYSTLAANETIKENSVEQYMSTYKSSEEDSWLACDRLHLQLILNCWGESALPAVSSLSRMLTCSESSFPTIYSTSFLKRDAQERVMYWLTSARQYHTLFYYVLNVDVTAFLFTDVVLQALLVLLRIRWSYQFLFFYLSVSYVVRKHILLCSFTFIRALSRVVAPPYSSAFMNEVLSLLNMCPRNNTNLDDVTWSWIFQLLSECRLEKYSMQKAMR